MSPLIPTPPQMAWYALAFATGLAAAALTGIATAAEPAASDPPATGAAADTKVVIVEGVGLDVESARKDAYRAAVRQVLGTLVDSETLVENDQLVTDKVVVFSDGFVEKVEEMPNGVTKDGGLVRLRVKAFVKSGQIKDRLLRANELAPASRVIEIEDADSLLAQVITTQERKIGARDLFLAAAKGFPASCFQAEAFPLTPANVRTEGDKVACDVRIKISARPKEYEEFAKLLITFLETLSPVAISTGPVPAFPAPPIPGNYDDSIRWNNETSDLAKSEAKTIKRMVVSAPIAERLVQAFDKTGNNPLLGFGQAYNIFTRREAPIWSTNGNLVTYADSQYAAQDQAFKNRSGRNAVHICAVPNAVPPYGVRLFAMDPMAAQWLDDLPVTVICTIAFLRSGSETSSESIRLQRFGFAAPNGLDNLCHCFVPGEIGRYFHPAIEFTVPVTVPAAAFTKGLKLECTLTNGSPEAKSP